jgi:hypothetical protein
VSPGFAGSALPAVGADAVGHADRLADTHRHDQHADKHDAAHHDNDYPASAGWTASGGYSPGSRWRCDLLRSLAEHVAFGSVVLPD